MKLSSLIVILVLFSSSLFAGAFSEWKLLSLTISGILQEGYELKEVTVDPTSTSRKYNILYHFIRYESYSIIICSVDIEYGIPTGTLCYLNPTS